MTLYIRYTARDLLSLVTMVSTVALDTRLSLGVASHDVECCLSVLLNAIPEQDWAPALRTLCVRLAGLTNHHHNKVVLLGACAQDSVCTPRRVN